MATGGQAPVLTGSQPDVPFLFPDHAGPVLPTDLSVAALVTSIVFALLAIASVALRFYAQRKSKSGIALDGILLLVALVIAIGLCILSTWAALCGGLGWPLLWLASPAGLRFQKAIDGGQILWGVSIATIRTSLLLFYRRIFTTRGFQHTTTVIMVINACWLLVFIIVTALTYSVNRTEQNSIDYPAWLIANGVSDIVLDLTVLCLPLFVIRKLNMSSGKKWGIAGMFWLGAFCVVVSIVRVVYFSQLARLPESDRQFGGE
ncbi:MAG: hypothetical protein GOMPHAMPRED_002647 [Gomphillus americanus]|uniref:Rhodopsin domain-containing protein n=1 Tax=Gomphillus americanus TaxID=1940652 RepID=A0A8H3FDR1_9LECA|nr:MAG: hypothetical protein GOMPHAMPRED_002647 [Gomphillus americanus]